jgi:hypothetical protein
MTQPLTVASRLRASAALMLALTTAVPSGFAQQTGAGASAPDSAASNLPSAPAPRPTEPVSLRTSERDFTKPLGHFLPNPVSVYRPTTIAKASFTNSVRLTDLMKDGKLYLSLSDALALPLKTTTTSPSPVTISTSPIPTFCAPRPAQPHSARLPAL